MVEEKRPDPDELLQRLRREEEKKTRGRLKIFIGMAAGVGKTYAMLRAGHQRKKEGVDVVLAYLETHGRLETAALAEGLEYLPRARGQHRDVVIEEFDLDALLQRRPALALVDELPHSNAPWCRHPKRYQDVLEILGAGIDVYTTVNVQHLESRADTVRQITGITIHETVPDSLLDEADEVELIDIAPDELIKRLTEGKIYPAERAESAKRNFFQTGNLTALREMSLRLTAENVDRQLRDYMETQGISGPWKTTDRLLVAVGPSPYSEYLVRWTRRMAAAMEAPWLAASVDTPKKFTEKDQRNLTRNLNLARRLGAEVIQTEDINFSQGLLRVARERNVTQIVVGKPKETFFSRVFRGVSLFDRLIRDSGSIDIYVVTGKKERKKDREISSLREYFSSGPRQYVSALLLVAGMTILNFFISPFIGYRAVSLIYLFSVSLAAVWMGRGPILLAASLSAILWDFIFIPPIFTFYIKETHDIIMFLMFFLNAIVSGILTSRIRSSQVMAQKRGEQSVSLHRLMLETAGSTNVIQLLEIAKRQAERIFETEAAVFLPDEHGRLNLRTTAWIGINKKELSVASWAYQNSKNAGRFTDTLPLSDGLYIPLAASGQTIGVMGLRMAPRGHLSIDEESILSAFCAQIAVGLEKELARESALKSEMSALSEKLYKSLLDSVSHELRTPISTIIGATDALADPAIEMSGGDRRLLIGEITKAGRRLNRLVEHLLEMTRLESGALKLRRQWCDIHDIVRSALKESEQEVQGHRLHLDIPANLPIIQLDSALMEGILENLIHNAARHTPEGSDIFISIRTEKQDLILEVADNGPGLGEVPARLFEKFFRLPGSKTGGTGLGLSIVKGFVEAQGGVIIARNRDEGGALFLIRFPDLISGERAKSFSENGGVSLTDG